MRCNLLPVKVCTYLPRRHLPNCKRETNTHQASITLPTVHTTRRRIGTRVGIKHHSPTTHSFAVAQWHSGTEHAAADRNLRFQLTG